MDTLLAERLILTGLLAAAWLPLGWALGRRRGPAWLQAGALLLIGAGLLGVWTSEPGLSAENGEQRFPGRVEQVSSDGYVSSSTCRMCHPREYDTWHGSFHRTMTQRARPGVVLGRFDGQELEAFGRQYRLERRGDEFWMVCKEPPREEIARERQIVATLRSAMSAPFLPETARADVERQLQEHTARITELEQTEVEGERPILQTTGSHHYQVYWYEDNLPGELHTLPFVWMIQDQRWSTRASVFLTPPTDEEPDFGPWNNNCIKCHTTNGKPLPYLDDPDNLRIESQVAEMGIACEACHGPGEEHVAVNRDPIRRQKLLRADQGDPTIVQPTRLDHRRASQVCGYCHAVSSFHDEKRYWVEGSPFRPGEDLHAVKAVVWPRSGQRSASEPTLPLENSFWPDGTVRLLGREYNGLLDSPCFQRGTMSCMSCHRLHGMEPDDQLAPGMRGDQACLQCHEEYAARIEAHTHHPPDSSGSRCMNCHMPYSVYGLLKCARSHTIESPNVAVTLDTGRPNACNQCHLDQTLAWTSGHIARWYGQPEVAVEGDEARISATLLWLLRGDAAQRALAAWTLGWEDAVRTSGDRWQAPYLIRLLDDPYPAVRHTAARSLRLVPGFQDLQYDFNGPREERQQAAAAALRRWEETQQGQTRISPRLLMDEAGQPLEGELDRLAQQRDDRPVTISE